MPRIEFESDEQKELFNQWLTEKYQDRRVNLIGEYPRMRAGESLEVAEIDDEPVHIEANRVEGVHSHVAIVIGEGKIMGELKEAGIIFETGKKGPEIISGGHREPVVE